MKLASIRTPDGIRVVRQDGDQAVDVGVDDLVTLLHQPDWRSRAEQGSGPVHDVNSLDFAPLVTAPEKIICVGLNYRPHIIEMGREIPQHPTLFAKFTRSLIGAYDDIVLPEASSAVDWEAELGVVIGTEVRHADVDQARNAIAGYTVVNDVTMRDWQYRTPEWLQGKTFEASTPVGPWLVTPDDVGEAGLDLACTVDGETVQQAKTSDLVFGAAELISYISTFITLAPGDLIATGTPGGVGHARRPARYLQDGALLETSIEHVGRLANRIVGKP